VGCFKSIVWKGFEVLLPEALYKIDKQCQDLTAISGFYKNSHSLFLLVTSNHRQFLECHRSPACMVSALSMAICP